MAGEKFKGYILITLVILGTFLFTQCGADTCASSDGQDAIDFLVTIDQFSEWVSPPHTRVCLCVYMAYTDQTFYELLFSRAYRNVFSLEDGSTIDPNDNHHMVMAYDHMVQLMAVIGVKANKTLDNDTYTMSICHHDMPRILFLSVLGNMMPKPGEDKDWSSVTGTPFLPVIVVDRTGKLKVSTPFSTLRSFYLEALILISIIAIVRLVAIQK